MSHRDWWCLEHDELMFECADQHNLQSDVGFIKSIQFNGQFVKGLKSGHWDYLFDGKIIGGGEFDEFGLKINKWIECDEMHDIHCQVVYSGEYRNGLRFGEWITLYKNNQIGGGNYDENGMKTGFWIDIHENFKDCFQYVYLGEYKNGQRQGEWNLKDLINNEIKQAQIYKNQQQMFNNNDQQ